MSCKISFLSYPGMEDHGQVYFPGVCLESGLSGRIKRWCLFLSGGWQDETWPDGWTAVTRDGKRSAQFEHTLLVTDTGCEILTRRLDSAQPHFTSQF